METDDPRELLRKAMHLQINGRSLMASRALTSPQGKPPWDEIYPPPGFVDALVLAVQSIKAENLHYVGLCEEKIWRRLRDIEGLALSMMDMFGYLETRSELPPLLRGVRFYGEGAPRDVQVWLQDTLVSGSPHPILDERRQPGLRCIAAVGAALKQVPRIDGFDWVHGTDYVIGRRSEIRGR